MGLTAIILLILLGMFLLALEILVLPGFVVGVIGAGLILYAIYSSYVTLGVPIAHYVLLGTVASNIIGLVLLFRSNTWKKVSLNTSISGKVNMIEQADVNVGSVGISVSRLNPIGKIEIDGKVFEARSNGEYLNADEEIEVIKIDGNKIYVKSKNKK